MPSDPQFFPGAIAWIGDVDLDNHSDYAMSAPTFGQNAMRVGAIMVFSGKSGSLVHMISGKTVNEYLGVDLAAAGDVDGDGRPDILARAGQANNNGLSVFSGRNAQLLHFIPDSCQRVTSVGDWNQDGYADFAYADFTWIRVGRVNVCSGLDAKILATFTGQTTYSFYGFDIDGSRDFDNDQRPDLLIMEYYQSGTHWSRLHAISSKTAKLIVPAMRIENQQCYLAALADADGDGRSDIALRAQPGCVILSGVTFQPVSYIATATYDVRDAGDVNNDGRSDVLVEHMVNGGGVDIWTARQLSLTTDSHAISAANGGRQLYSIKAPSSLGNHLYVLCGSSSGTRPGFSIGNQHVPLNPDAYFTLLLTNQNSLVTPSIGFLSLAGDGQATMTVPAGLASALVGRVLDHAFVVFRLADNSAQLASNPVPLLLTK